MGQYKLVISVFCGVVLVLVSSACFMGWCDWSVSCLQCVVWGAVIGQSAVYSVLCGVLWLVMQSAVYSVLCGALWLVSQLLTMGSSSSDSMSSRSSSRALTRLSSWLFSSKTCRFWNTNEVMFNTLHCMYSATTNRHNGYLYSIFSRVLYSIDANDVKGISKSLLMFCLCNVIVGTQGQPLIIKDQSKVSSNEVKYTLVPQFNSTQIHMRSSMTVPCQSPICTMYMY